MNESSPSGPTLTREAILDALAELNRELAGRGVAGEICIFGGASMVLAFNARLATKDVDAIFQPAALVRELAAEIAKSRNLPEHWLNDGVKGFFSPRHETFAGNLPQFSNLCVTMPVPEYLLAMKCLASRIGATGGEADDTDDIVFLIRQLNLKTPQAVMDIVSAYYPANRIPMKAQFLVESLFEEGRL